MKRTARPPRRQFVAVGAGWLLLALVVAIPGAGSGEWLVFGGFALLLLWVTLASLLARATVEGGVLTLRALRPRHRLRVPVDGIVRYAPDAAGRWWVETAERRVPVTVQEPWELHAALAELIPERLGAKRLRPQHLPPPEDLRNLWTYDVDRLLSETIGRVVLVVAIVAATRNPGFLYGFLLMPLLFDGFEMFARLDVTRDGIVRRGPFHRRTILWSDAQAIFCEKPRVRRSFVVTSRETAVEIPPHLARDLELMSKLFRSLPDGTLLVNFDETTFRGYRRRKKAKEKAPQEDLLPALTHARSAGFSPHSDPGL